jgi:hypothetical protein
MMNYTVNKKRWRRNMMAKKLDDGELMSFKGLLMANSLEIDVLAQRLIEKGIMKQDEFFTNLKQVQADYTKNKT